VGTNPSILALKVSGTGLEVWFKAGLRIRTELEFWKKLDLSSKKWEGVQ
jgi:hypothetical protein